MGIAMRLLVLIAVLLSTQVFATPENPSEYIVNHTVPACDAGNPLVVKITPVDTANLSTILNDPSKSIFCFSPSATPYFTSSNGSSIPITITRSGTSGQRRYLILDDGLDTYPSKLAAAQQANIFVQFGNIDEPLNVPGANYWTVYRMSSFESGGNELDNPFTATGIGGSSNIIMDKMHVHGFRGGIDITTDSNDVVIQRSRIGDQSSDGLTDDGTCVSTGRMANMVTIRAYNSDVLILDNEIYNCNDGFQTVRQPAAVLDVDAPGLIIDGNIIWLDDSMYANSDGTPNTGGNYACAENAMDFKYFSQDPAKPVVISNNYMWGFKKNAVACGGSSDLGSVLVVHFDSTNAIIKNNILAWSDFGVGNAGATPEDILYINNIFYGIGNYDTDQFGSGVAFLMADSKNTDVIANIFVNTKASWFRQLLANEDTNSILECNVVINRYGNRSVANMLPHGAFYLTDAAPYANLKDNFAYGLDLVYNGGNTGLGFSETGTRRMPYNLADGHVDFSFTYDFYTNSPKTKTLKGVRPAQAAIVGGQFVAGKSVHTVWCDYGDWVVP